MNNTLNWRVPRGNDNVPRTKHSPVSPGAVHDCVRSAARDGVHETMNEMHWRRFEKWLNTVKGLDARTIGSRISNCKRVEEFEGDLQSQFDTDGLSSLMERLTYSTEDARYRREPREHRHGNPLVPAGFPCRAPHAKHYRTEGARRASCAEG